MVQHVVTIERPAALLASDVITTTIANAHLRGLNCAERAVLVEGNDGRVEPGYRSTNHCIGGTAVSRNRWMGGLARVGVARLLHGTKR